MLLSLFWGYGYNPKFTEAFSMLVRYIENKTFALTEANLVLLLYLTRLRNAVKAISISRYCILKLIEFLLPMPSNLEFKEIKELRILPRNGCFYAEFVYQLPSVKADVDKSRALGIDPGVNNWLTCVSKQE